MNEIKTRFRRVDGLSIRYAESEGPRDRDALLLGTLPESLYTYHAVWARLAEHARLVAVDLPGFGHSEMREELLSPAAMSEFVVRIADEFGLERPDVIGPDIGTSATLLAAARHPGRFRTAVVGSGGAAAPLQLTGPLDDWVNAQSLEPYRALGPKDIVTIAMGKMGTRPPEIVYEDYLAGYTGDRMARQIEYIRAYRTDLPVLRELLPGIETPVQLITGRDDHLVPVANAEFLHERLPDSRLDVIDVGHYVWEEAPDEYASLVVDWWRTH